MKNGGGGEEMATFFCGTETGGAKRCDRRDAVRRWADRHGTQVSSPAVPAWSWFSRGGFGEGLGSFNQSCLKGRKRASKGGRSRIVLAGEEYPYTMYT